jgi:hypothetical protein
MSCLVALPIDVETTWNEASKIPFHIPLSAQGTLTNTLWPSIPSTSYVHHVLQDLALSGNKTRLRVRIHSAATFIPVACVHTERISVLRTSLKI